jgi:hypothetical protein
MKFVIWHNGDASVGMPGERATLEIDVESYADEVRGDYTEQVRDALRVAFSGLWDTSPHIKTEHELAQEQDD